MTLAVLSAWSQAKLTRQLTVVAHGTHPSGISILFDLQVSLPPPGARKLTLVGRPPLPPVSFGSPADQESLQIIGIHTNLSALCLYPVLMTYYLLDRIYKDRSIV
jgi:hypothetical protein